jgi:hypothetical protein
MMGIEHMFSVNANNMLYVSCKLVGRTNRSKRLDTTISQHVAVTWRRKLFSDQSICTQLVFNLRVEDKTREGCCDIPELQDKQ